MPIVCLGLLLCGLGGGSPGSPEGPLAGFTAPVRAVTLSAEITGTIARLPVVEGAAVRSGDELVALDDRVQRVRTEIVRQRATSSVAEDLAAVRLQRARQERDRLRSLDGDALASVKELADVEAEVEALELSATQACEDRSAARLDLQLQEALLARYSLRAPFSGFLARRAVEVGQTTDVGQPLVELVQVDPLHVILECPLGRARALRGGQTLPVRDAADATDVRTGEVILVAPVANPASQTVRVKLRVANPDLDWLAGMKIFVDLPPAEAAGPALTRSQEEH